MSLRLATGHKLVVSDTAELARRLDTFRQTARAYARTTATRGLAARLAHRYDLAMTDPDEPGTPESLLVQTTEAILDAWNDTSDSTRLPHDCDVACRLSVLPDPRAFNTVYLIVHAAHADAYTDLLRDMPGVTPFGIDTRGDPFPGVSWPDWQARKDVWERLLEPSFVPSEAGLSLDAIGRVLPIDLEPDAIEAVIPSLEARLTRTAGEIAVRRHLRACRARHEIPECGQPVMAATMAYLTDDRFPRERDAVQHEIAERLPSVLTDAHLDRPIPGHGRSPDDA